MKQTEDNVGRELVRIQEEYHRRTTSKALIGRYSLFNEAALNMFHEVERNLLAMLKQHQFTNLANKNILDVGCGSGTQLGRFISYGAQPENLAGIDLLAERIELARSSYPSIDWRVGSAHQLPFPDASFNLVMLFTMFSSILDRSLRQSIADEIWRVRKPDGLILCYDFAFSNPRNPAVEGISRRELQLLFKRPGTRFDFRRVTLAPPISRLLARRASWLVNTLEQLKFLNTHLIGVIAED